MNRLGMKHLCTKESQIGRFLKRAELHCPCSRKNLGGRGHQSRNVFPNLNFSGIKSRANYRGGIVRGLKAKGGGRTVPGRTNEALSDRNPSIRHKARNR